MLRAKKRKFRYPPPWFFAFVSTNRYQELSAPCVSNGVFPLLTGELGVIDCGIRFIVSRKV